MPDAPVIQVDTSALARLVSQLREGPQILREVATQVMTTRMRQAETAAKRGASRGPLKARSGHLQQRVSARIERDAEGVLGRLGVFAGDARPLTGGGVKIDPLVYAGVQEYGSRGPIRPKAGKKLLTIPLDAAKTPTGQTKFTAREAAEKFPGGTFWRTIGGALFGGGIPILFGKRGKTDRSKPIPLFVGVKQVTIPARPYLRPALEGVLPGIRTDLESGLVVRLIKAARQA